MDGHVTVTLKPSSPGNPPETLTAQPKRFSTGSEGFWAGGKVSIDGERYQVSINLVRIGSKP